MRPSPTRLAPAAAALLAGCNLLRPAPPTVSTRAVSFAGPTPAGLALRVQLAARNPNRYALRVRGVDARVTVAGQRLGPVHVPRALTLPARREVLVEAELLAPWTNLPALAAATLMLPAVPYRVEGEVRASARGVTRAAPFRFEGTLPRAQVIGW